MGTDTDQLAGQPRTRPRVPFLVLFVVLVVLGAVLRLYKLGDCYLWIDEVTVLWFADAQRTAGDIVSEIYRAEFKGFSGQHMPFQYVLLNVFLRIFEGGDLAADGFRIRLPFALMGILSLPLFYLAGVVSYGRKVGLWVLALAAVSFFHVFHSRDATSYAPLIFFVALNLYGLAALARRRKEPLKAKRRGAACFLLGSLGVLFTHLTGWLFLFSEGVLLVAWGALDVWRARTFGYADVKKAASFLVVPLLLLAVSALPFLRFIFAAVQGGEGEAGVVPVDAFSLPILLHHIGYYGWGKGGGRFTAFVAAVLTGVIVGLRRKEWRGHVLFQLGLLVLPFILFFAVNYRNYVPRYLSITYVPLLGFAALGVQVAVTAAAGKLRRPAAEPMLAGLAGVCLVAWAVGPFRALYEMRDKREPISRIHRWILEQVPEHGLLVWRNGYYTRDIPRVYPVGNRSVAFGEYPNAGIPEDVLNWNSRNAYSFSQRFPLAPLITKTEFEDPRWPWIKTTFSRSALVSDDVMPRLWAWGLSSGKDLKELNRFTIYFNTEEDVWAHVHSTGRPTVYPVGPGWRYPQTRQGHLFAAPLPGAQLKSRCPEAGAGSYLLVLQTMGEGTGRLAAQMVQGQNVQEAGPVNFAPSGPQTITLGPFEIEPGESIVTLAPSLNSKEPLLVHGFELVPAERSEPQEESKDADVE